MKANFKFKFLQTLNNKKNEKGFTLIELLVVVIIIGVLAAIALPNLLSQVAKGRQSEAKNNLGAVNRAQQAYRLEAARFGTLGNGTDGTLPVKISGEFYDYDDIGSPDQVKASHEAIAKSTYENDLKDYGATVYQGTDGGFTALICEGNSVDGSAEVITGTNGISNDGSSIPSCGSDTSQIK